MLEEELVVEGAGNHHFLRGLRPGRRHLPGDVDRQLPVGGETECQEIVAADLVFLAEFSDFLFRPEATRADVAANSGGRSADEPGSLADRQKHQPPSIGSRRPRWDAAGVIDGVYIKFLFARASDHASCSIIRRPMALTSAPLIRSP